MADEVVKEENTSKSAYDSVTDYNTKREEQIGNMYDANLVSKKTALENAYNQNMSDWQQNYDKVEGQYKNSQNSLAQTYEQNRRNNNMQAAANGINTGAGSQMALAQSGVYQGNSADLEKKKNETYDTMNQQALDLKTTYQNDIVQAQSDNDAQRAAALLDEYSNAYNRLESSAKTLATYGDFSGYAALFGDATAENMKQMWIVQNPDDAYNTGAIDANRYFSITGKWPVGYGASVGASSGGDGGYSGGGSGGGGSGGGETYSINFDNGHSYTFTDYNKYANEVSRSAAAQAYENAYSHLNI